mgnify:CR=1 FL=1
MHLTAQIVPSWQLVTASQLPASSATGACPGADGSCSWASMPGGAVTITFTARAANEKVLVLADISRLQATTVSKNTALAIFVDGTKVAETNSGSSYVWEYDALSFHGVASGLVVGSHTAELKYRQQQGSVYVPKHETGGTGQGYVRLTSMVLPDAVLATDAVWPAATHSVSGSSWMSIPTGAISTSFTLSGDEVRK